MKCIRGFTLIELLVVISIIALLLAVLIPSLRTAMLRAKQVASTSNMRQIGIAMGMYADDNRGYFPLTNHLPDEAKYSWVYTLSCYLGERSKSFEEFGKSRSKIDKIRICPADPKRKERIEKKASSYILNQYIALDDKNYLGQLKGVSYKNKHRLRSPGRTITVFVCADDFSMVKDHTHSMSWFENTKPLDKIKSDIQIDRYKNKTLFLYADTVVESIKAKKIIEMADNKVNFAKPPG